MTTELMKLEEAATLYIVAKEERDSAVIRMEQRKAIVERLLEELGETEIDVPYTEQDNIKVKIAVRSSRKLDKEKMSEDLEVEEDVIKQDFLMKAIEDRKISYQEYRSYYFQDTKEIVSIRKSKV